jgi:nucleoside phosphorylase
MNGSDWSPRVAVVLTAIQVETEAVLRHLIDRDRQRVSDTWFQTGRFDGWAIAVAEVGPGNAGAATVATRALAHFNPEIAAFVGVAGGVKDVDLGDVVVGTKVYGYESGKETPNGFQPRPDVQNSNHELEQRARVLRSDTIWHRRLDPALWPDNKPRVHVAPIAAGEAVVATNAGRIAAQLRQHYSDALAVEMEGRGFLEAAHIDSRCRAVVVRGISDLLSEKAATDTQGWQHRGADAAAAFFFGMLALDAGAPQSDYTPHSTQAVRSANRETAAKVDPAYSLAPDWSIHDLFHHLRPTISADGPTTIWDEVGNDVLDKLSTGQLNAWGRVIVRGPMTTYLSLAPIDPNYRTAARFTYAFLLDNHERDKHVTQNTPSSLPDYGDLRVNRAQALKLWPSSLRESWHVTTITLVARYFGPHKPDEITAPCHSLSLFDAEIKTEYDPSGAPLYQRLIRPAFVLAKGIDASVIRELPWKPQQLLFSDSATGAKHEFFLSGIDTTTESNTVKFLLNSP